MKAGYAVLNPMLSMAHPDGNNIDWQDWINSDLKWVEVADIIVLLPGESKGAEIEVAHASKYGVPLWYAHEVECLCDMFPPPQRGSSMSLADSTPGVDITNRGHENDMIELTDADVGKQFILRNGDVRTLEKHPHSVYVYHHGTGEDVRTVTAQGKYWAIPGHESFFDIVARHYPHVPCGGDLPGPDWPDDRPIVFDELRQEIIEVEAKADLLRSVKDSNPKDAVGIRKVPFSCLSMPVMAEVAVAMLEGARKYGRHNYRVIGVRASVYYDAAFRHLMASWEGENTDPDSGLDHITKAIATLMVLRDAKIRGKCVDDRPPGTAGFVKAVNELAAQQCDRYPDAKPPFLATGAPDQYEAA
jgi:hypothetical protein